MFHHQSSPAVSKELFSPVTGSRVFPSALSYILIPQKLQTHIQVTPVNNNHGVELWCGYSKITVRINLDVLNFRSSAAYFRLGTCPASRADGSVLYFRYNLNECGSSISVVKGQLVYSNEVVYRPENQGSVIRAVPLKLPVQCVYDRFYYSYKIGFLPEFRLRSFRKTLSRKQVFSVSLRNDKWEELPENRTYVLGESVYFEVGVDVISEDRSVYVEACHVTASEDSTSTQHYDVISNFGCMVDSMRTGSQSRFISRQENILRFSLDTFSFSEAESERFYLHCTVAVGKSSASVSAKSCTYSESEHRWEELDGDAAVCNCCNSECLPAGFTASRLEQFLVSSKSWSFIHKVSSKTSEEFLNTVPGFILLHHPEESHREEEEILAGEELEEEVLVGVVDMVNDEISDEGVVEGKKDGDKEKEKDVQETTRRTRWRSSLKESGKTKSL
ncbi:zona pellucida glycoprotein 3d tandem duplicate 1 isoform X1 [Silurus meridionalis]|uniref:Zona pellucida sperm-binding protein 3 n=1 Tax=Silurus meridionalis TaxID=175797 RepID=A0A8T0ALE3_SILME|nr:zona pellucida glycoprotein 3d tandem duplicate 1 isoform X1 [Silurus meridionalis]KAF7692114.1 hypothetical protein HF521_011081 [Silurus meridionalis]